MNKVLSLDQAISCVRSGCTLGLGGMTLYRRPVAFVRALLRTDVTDLTLLALTCGAVGIYAALPVFWTLPTVMLSGTAAASGIASQITRRRRCPA